MFNLGNKLKRSILKKVGEQFGGVLGRGDGGEISKIKTPQNTGTPSEGILDLLYGWFKSGEKDILLSEAIKQMETKTGTGAGVSDAMDMINFLNESFGEMVNSLTIEQSIKYAIENWFPHRADLLAKWGVK